MNTCSFPTPSIHLHLRFDKIIFMPPIVKNLNKIKNESHNYNPGYLNPITTQIVQKAQYYSTIRTIMPKQ